MEFLREFIKRGYLEGIGKMEEYKIILGATAWFDKGILKEEDLKEIYETLNNKEIITEMEPEDYFPELKSDSPHEEEYEDEDNEDEYESDIYGD